MNEQTLSDSMLSTIDRFGMIGAGDTIVVAVSGGPDSVALLHALWSLRESLGVRLHVAHLNHSFRGDESDRDAEHVRALAGELGLGVSIEKIDVPLMQRTLRVSAEEAARLVRYDFLERTADAISAGRIALGHTASDQAETVLLNILRGTGVDGLAGIPPMRGRFIRPLIEVTRAQVNEYVTTNGLSTVMDSTNLQPLYTRNRVRLDLLPRLRAEYNADVDSALLRIAELAREDSAYLSVRAVEALLSIMRGQAADGVTLDRSSFRALPRAIRRRVAREAVRRVLGDLTDISFAHIEDLLELADSGSAFRQDFPRGLVVDGDDSVVRIYLPQPEAPRVEFEAEVPIPGSVEVAAIALRIEASTTEERVDPVRPRGSMDIVLDADAIVGRLIVRNWRPGDRIRPLGMSGSRKAQDVFTDLKIPRAARHRAPLLVDDGGIVWMPGIAVSDAAKVTDKTRRYLRLTARETDGTDNSSLAAIDPIEI